MWIRPRIIRERTRAPGTLSLEPMYRRSVTSLGNADYLLVASEGSRNIAERPGVKRLIDNLSIKF